MLIIFMCEMFKSHVWLPYLYKRELFATSRALMLMFRPVVSLYKNYNIDNVMVCTPLVTVNHRADTVL